MTLQTNEVNTDYVVAPQFDIDSIPRIQHTYDLPHGGNWWVVDLDCPEQVNNLPGWLTDGEKYLMKSQVVDVWYLWVPVRASE